MQRLKSSLEISSGSSEEQKSNLILSKEVEMIPYNLLENTKQMETCKGNKTLQII